MTAAGAAFLPAATANGRSRTVTIPGRSALPPRTDKVVPLEWALGFFHDGMTLMYGGFGGIGTPPTLTKAILESGVTGLFLIGNDAGFPEVGPGPLFVNRRVRRLLASHIGSNPVAGEQMSCGELEVEFSPQGTLAERIRAGGMGLGGVLVDVGLGTVAERGKQKLDLEGRSFLVESALTAEVAIVYAAKADPLGNLVFDKTARNFNPLVAMAGDITIVEADEIVPVGALDPECIVTPGIFVDMVVQSQGIHWTWVWEQRKATA